MKEIIKFRVTLFRDRFSIYGISNLIAFWILAGICIVVPEYVMNGIDEYLEISVLIAIAYLCFCIGIIFRKGIDEEKVFVRTFFDKLDENKYERYITNRGLVIYQIIFLYLIMPMKVEDFNYFSIIFAGFELLTLAEIIICVYVSEIMFNYVRQIVTVGFSLIIILTARKIINIPQFEFNSTSGIILGCMVGIFCILFSFKIVGVEKNTSKFVIGKELCKKSFIKNNKDFIFVIRNSRYMEPLFILFLSGCLSVSLRENRVDAFITFLSAYVYILYYIYVEIIKYESNCFILLYSAGEIHKLKKEKIINTIKLALVFCGVSFIVFLYFLPLALMCVAFITAIILFILNTYLVKFSYEKHLGCKDIVSNKEQLKMVIVLFIEIICIACVAEVL